jgi:hypothetical protein
MSTGLMTLKEHRGATAEEWGWFDMVLGLGANLLPCVQADAQPTPGSSIKTFGKVPSMYSADGTAFGFKEWQTREIMSAEVQQWATDRRLNLCVRTGPISGLYAFDVDIEEPKTSIAVQQELGAAWLKFGITNMPTRARENSCKFLLPFRMAESCKKRKIKLDKNPKGPAIELLADGQQFVAAGTHSSGVRYRWYPDLPTDLPTLTLVQLDQIWETLTRTYATTGSTSSSPSAQAKAPLTQDQQTLRTEISDSEWADLLSALKFLAPLSGDEQLWAEIGISLLSIKHSEKPVRQLWLDFSKAAPNWESGTAEQWWETHARG